jgi:hypothetical protein
VLIARCGWHGRYFGRAEWMGIAAWWPLWRIQFTDGMCPKCEERFTRESQRLATCAYCGEQLRFTEQGWVHALTGRTIITRTDGDGVVRDDHVALPSASA